MFDIDEDGNKYEGKIINGKKNGLGTLIYKNNSRYIGHFKDNLRDGYGVLTYYNNNKYYTIYNAKN